MIMKEKRILVVVVLGILMALLNYIHAQPTVIDFGAIGDGSTDDSKAFGEAWKAACGASSPESAVMIIPQNKSFLLKPTLFLGPCKSPRVTIQIHGHIVAPKNPSDYSGFSSEYWLQFENINGLVIDGRGTGDVNGRGAEWWKMCSLLQDSFANSCDQRPTLIKMRYCNNLKIVNLGLSDSPRNFFAVSACDGVEISHVHIQAPKDAPNTDGINLIGATNVHIHDSVISCGDDCIAMNNHAHDVNITQVSCGPGHGISIGSLGADSVEKVHISNCNFTGTSNGVRIKTWQGGDGFVRDVTYEHISVTDVQYPILIDQYYCPNKTCQKLNETSSIKISDITYTNIFGSSETTEAITFNCSKLNACQNIQIDQIKLTSTLKGQPAESQCINAHGQVGQSVIPEIKCLN